MGASDGPVFATPRPGSKPIISDPCGCPECAPGEGLTSMARYLERTERLLGPVTKTVSVLWCPSCEHSVITTAIRAGPGWHNTCRHGHTWTTTD